jgi:polyisoprenoid-binding protein YceI
MASTETPSAAGPRAMTDDRTVWQIDPKHTLVEFAAWHMMVTTVKGSFSGVSGTIRADEDDPTRSSVEVEIDAASLDTREDRRDAHLRSADFLDVERHPSITFRSTRVEQVGPDRLRIVGALAIRGTSREVVLDTTVNGRARTPEGLEVAGFTADAEINRKDYGLNWNVALEAGGVIIGDTVKIRLEIEAIKQE